jgi:hypothetical protein
MIVAVNEVAKTPKILSTLEDILYIKDKRKNELKSVVIPAKYLDLIQDKIEMIEYQMWKEKNKKALSEKLDSSDVVNEIGEKLD